MGSLNTGKVPLTFYSSRSGSRRPSIDHFEDVRQQYVKPLSASGSVRYCSKANYAVERRLAFNRDLLSRFSALPGAITVSQVAFTPISGAGWNNVVGADSARAENSKNLVNFNVVSPVDISTPWKSVSLPPAGISTRSGPPDFAESSHCQPGLRAEALWRRQSDWPYLPYRGRCGQAGAVV